MIQDDCESARPEVFKRWLDITVNLTAAKIVLNDRLRDLDEEQLKPIIDLLWEDLAHAISLTYHPYNCADNCFISLPEKQRHVRFKSDLWGREKFGEAVMARRDDMRLCGKIFFSNIFK